jgi:hypothetical protein
LVFGWVLTGIILGQASASIVPARNEPRAGYRHVLARPGLRLVLLAALSQSLAFIICPALATRLIAAGAAAVWIGLLCAGCLGTVAVGARLRRVLTSDQDFVTEAPATRPEPVAGRRRAARSGTRG